jgi:polysaccharide biosynthesis/export protein
MVESSKASLMKQIAVLLSVVSCLAFLAGAAPPASAAQDGGAPASYRIGPRDLLSVVVFEDDKLSGERRVAENGTINMPLLGDVPVTGKTTAEIALQLKRLLEEKWMQRASVDVQIREYRSRPISVLGAVQNPGNLSFSGRWTLLEALTAAGGLANNHGRFVLILRRADNGLSDQISIDLDDLLVRGDPRANIPIFGNDLINVPPAVDLTVYCLGEVMRPGALTFKSSERVTVLAAIAHAGGLTDRAANKILVKRARPDDGPAEITMDYKRVLAGKEADVELRSGDVVVIKESFF